MSLSACERCWDDPCTCGHEYRRMKTEDVRSLRDVLNRILTERGEGVGSVSTRANIYRARLVPLDEKFVAERDGEGRPWTITIEARRKTLECLKKDIEELLCSPPSP